MLHCVATVAARTQQVVDTKGWDRFGWPPLHVSTALIVAGAVLMIQ
jgi:hypothetical protein